MNNKNTQINNIANLTDIDRARQATARTPYHALSASGEAIVPVWAQHRSVYRSAGRTLYLVETDRLRDAKRDLDALSRRGWEVHIDREGSSANITLSRAA